jgi:hypothetical protein
MAEMKPEYIHECEFLNLSNLMKSTPRSAEDIFGYNKIGIRPGENDECERLPMDVCSTNETCFEYKDDHYTPPQCISKTRKFQYNTPTTFSHRNVIPNREYNIKFTGMIESSDLQLFFERYGGTQASVVIYHRCVECVETGNVYLLFSSGVVLFGDLIENTRDYIMSLIAKMKETTRDICICGHSMGALLALITCYHWFKSDPEYFLSHVTCVCFGAYKCVPIEDETFTNLPNIKSYCTYDEGIVDAFIEKGQPSFKSYLPIIALSRSNRKQIDHAYTTTDGIVCRFETKLHGLEEYSNRILNHARVRGGRRRRKHKTKRKRKL